MRSSTIYMHVRGYGFLLAALLVLGFAGCGGGGGGGGGGGQAADFTLTVTPANVQLTAGGSGQVSLQATAINGFSSTVTVQATGLPAGITVSPSNVTIQPGAGQQVVVSAANSFGSTNTSLTFTANSGSISHSARLGISLVASLVPSRTKYVRTDAVTEYATFINRHWSLFSPTTNRIFVCDPAGNHVTVMDTTTQTRIATLDVPGAFGIDDTPDHSKIYVGTLIGDVYTIDPVALTVTGRVLASQIGSLGFHASIALVLSDGRLALLGAAGGIANVDGSSAFAVWNPADNSITVYETAFTHSFDNQPATIVCGGLENIAGFTRTADRTKVLIGSADSDDTLCEVDASTGSDNFTQVATFPARMTLSPDGKFIAVTSFANGDMLLLDQNNLALLAQFPVSGDLSSAGWTAFSGDSSTIFVTSPGIVYAYNVSTHQQTGWLPNLVVEPASGCFCTGPVTGPAVVDIGNGLLAGPMEEGVGFLDVGAMHAGPVGTQFANGFLNPPFGPASGGTIVTLSDPNSLNSTVNSVYFGMQRAPSVTPNGNQLSITSPAGAPGAVDVELLMNDGGQWILPESFSYGPTILQVTPDASTAEGGGTGIVYGYGFGSDASTSIPSDLKIKLGGQQVTVLGFAGNAYGVLSQPLPLEAIAFQIPAGTAGSKVDVTVSNSSGSATAAEAFSYLPPTQIFTAGSTALAQGIYDQSRDVYYFTDVNQVQVFSKTQGKFLAPIPIPPPSAGATQRLWGISLSPDSSKLAIADVSANVIYLLDPDIPATVKSFALPVQTSGIISDPAGVAINNAGMVYYTAVIQGGTGFHNFFKLDTTTGQVTDLKIDGPGLTTDALLRTAMSADGVRAYFDDDGAVFSVDTATDTVVFAADDQGCCLQGGDYDLSLSSNNTRFASSSFLYDADLNAESTLGLNDREVLNIAYFFGMKLSPDGSMLFQPSTLGIDVIDGRLGTLRNRVALPFSFGAPFDTLVSDGKDNILLGIVGPSANQIAIIDLSSLPEPSPLPYSTVGTGMPMSLSVARVALSRPTVERVSVSQAKGVNRVLPHITPSDAASAFWTDKEPKVR